MFFKTILCLCAAVCLFAKIARAEEGLLLQSMTPEMLDGVGLSGETGVIVTGLDKSSPITKELKQRDVIVAANNQQISTSEQLIQIFDNSSDQPITLKVWRGWGGDHKNGEFKQVSIYPSKQQKQAGLAILGGAEFAKTNQGVVVTKADASGMFAVGDLVLQFNGKEIENVEEITQYVAAQPNAFSVLINRGGAQVSQTIKIGKNGSTSFSQSFVFG